MKSNNLHIVVILLLQQNIQELLSAESCRRMLFNSAQQNGEAWNESVLFQLQESVGARVLIGCL